YDLLNKANTLGIFQLESGGMRDLCRKFQISSVEHITALIALYRPGPMELIPEFIKRRHGEVKIEYEHPLLEPICRETYGIMVYQEQVMQATQVLAGYTLGGADLLRRAMGKKKLEEMAKQRETFVKGAARVNNIPAAKANQIFDLLEKFAGYGFNKSHAAAYAIVAYQTAYLKANYPVEFLCAMMTNDMGDTEKLSEYINEARKMGIEVLPPDVNESQVHFAPAPAPGGGLGIKPPAKMAQKNGHPGNNRLNGSGGMSTNGNGFSAASTAVLELTAHEEQAPLVKTGGNENAIRFGLAAIKGVGEVAVEAILKARREGGRFGTLADMCQRMDGREVNRKVLEGLIKCGACDSLGQNRATLFSQIDRTLGRAATIISDRQRGQSSLFGAFEERAAEARETVTVLPEWPQNELLGYEKELLGFYVTGHPLMPYAQILEKYSLANTVTLAQLPNRALTRIGGMIAAVQAGVSKKSGKPYAMVTLEDLQGSVQVLCMNENYDKNRELLVAGKPILVIGEVNLGDDRPKIFPQEIMPLDDVPRRYTKAVHLRLNTGQVTDEKLQSVHELVGAHAGKCPLFLCFTRPAGDIVFMEANERFFVNPSRELQAAADAMFGEGTYFPKADTSLPERQQRRWERKAEPVGAEQ
ncbi:MAG TPA: OB-fold nucleic acid binding domain-containing protein, partial [Candidatus Dormibacteraeota bacterium]|nr:OB-fold nucleic acid binding domain-containing protein [Candidatus Dormibacteraeota bacterium]